MKHKLFALLSTLVVFTMIVTAGGMAAENQAATDNQTVYLPLVLRR